MIEYIIRHENQSTEKIREADDFDGNIPRRGDCVQLRRQTYLVEHTDWIIHSNRVQVWLTCTGGPGPTCDCSTENLPDWWRKEHDINNVYVVIGVTFVDNLVQDPAVSDTFIANFTAIDVCSTKDEAEQIVANNNDFDHYDIQKV